MLKLSTRELSTRKKVLIDEHEYVVRKMGNLEQLDISQAMRRLNILADKEAKTKLDEREERELETISKKLGEMFVNLFDDGGDQTKSRKLVASLSDEEITIMLTQIFPDPADVTEETKDDGTTAPEATTDTPAEA